MTSIADVSETLRQILEEEANVLARESGWMQRHRVLSGADFAQTLIFGWLGEPDITLDGLTQVAGRRDVQLTASALSQRFTQPAVEFLYQVLQRLTQVRLQVEAVPLVLLKRFRAVVVEDSTHIQLPDELAEVWQGCGDGQGGSQAGLKLFVRWDVLTGELHGPLLTAGRQADATGPFREQALPAHSLYLADQGFFEQERLRQWHHSPRGQRRYYLLRLPLGTALYTRRGHRLRLPGVLPQHETQPGELGVLLGQRARVPVRLIMQKLPEEVAKQRRERLWREAQDHGRQPSEEALYLAGWLILVTNVPRRLLTLAETLVVLTVRWQIELLFRLWKEAGQIDQWRSHQRWRILGELYAKLAAMLIQHWLIELGCWQDPQRSLVKAAQVVRREVGQLMVALRDGRPQQGVRRLLNCMRSGCRMNTRRQFPTTAQRLEGALVLGGQRASRPTSRRRRDQCRRWPAGKGWATSKPGRKERETCLT